MMISKRPTCEFQVQRLGARGFSYFRWHFYLWNLNRCSAAAASNQCARKTGAIAAVA
jgi:hypothetical protein